MDPAAANARVCLCGAATPCSSSCLFMLEEATWHTTAASQMHCRNGLTACVCVCESGCDPRPKCSGSECHYVTSVIWCLSTGDQDVNVSRFVPSVKTICQTDQRPENPNTRRGSLLKLLFFVQSGCFYHVSFSCYILLMQRKRSTSRVRDFTRSRSGVLLKSAKFARLVA